MNRRRSIKVLINAAIKPTDLMRVRSGLGACRDDYRWRKIPAGHPALGRRALSFDSLMFGRKYAYGKADIP